MTTNANIRIPIIQGIVPENYTGVCQNIFGVIKHYKDGKYHRENGPAIIDPTGRTEYYFNGCQHREDGPAIINPNGFTKWFIHGKLHREDGPAIQYSNGNNTYFIDGVELDSDEVEELINLGYPEKTAIKLTIFNQHQQKECANG